MVNNSILWLDVFASDFGLLNFASEVGWLTFFKRCWIDYLCTKVWVVNLVRRDVGLLSFAGDNGWLNFAREVKGWVVDIKLGLSYYAFRTLVPTQNGIRGRAESLYL